jgi:hypothetical protein
MKKIAESMNFLAKFSSKTEFIRTLKGLDCSVFNF